MPHAIPARGLVAAGKARNLQGGRFGRLFPNLPAATFGDPNEQHKNLQILAEAMVSEFDQPFDGADNEESGIPALYTYFGQFLDHDLTFDPISSFAKVKDAQGVTNFRTPAFDLDSLYGRGPDDQPYLYEADGKTIKLGNHLASGSPGVRDLQRNSDGRAIIGDPRNDENVIVSQLQALVISFHNAMVNKSGGATFADIQANVRHHYQYIIVNDFLSRIVNAKVLDDLKTDGAYDQKKIKFFRNSAGPLRLAFIPVEFAVAAYRLGHSMIRPGYRLNDATLLPIFPIPPQVQAGFPEGLTGFRLMNPNWGIDWGRFIDVDIRSYGSKTLDAAHKNTNFKRMQLAYRIDTALTKPLGTLPNTVVSNPPPSLALRNLERGASFGLPSGQEVARAMGVKPLPDDHILIGQGVDKPDKPLPNIASFAGGVFANNCPLWTYILAEAMQNKAEPDPKIPVTENVSIGTPQLGPVGGRIVAEVFLGLLFADPGSYLNVSPKWTPPGKPDFKLKDLVAEALAFEASL